jgi:hypothetical protein
MVIDAETGKTIADIPGQKHNHGVALLPETGRGFISDGSGSIVIFDLKRTPFSARSPPSMTPMASSRASFTTKPAGPFSVSPAITES